MSVEWSEGDPEPMWRRDGSRQPRLFDSPWEFRQVEVWWWPDMPGPNGPTEGQPRAGQPSQPGAWCPGELRMWAPILVDVPTADGAQALPEWAGNVTFRPPGETSSLLDVVPSWRIREDGVDRSHGRTVE